MILKNFKLVYLLLLIVACTNSKVGESILPSNSSNSNSKDYNNKTLQVFATVKNTDLRLTKISEQTFKNKVQPLET